MESNRRIHRNISWIRIDAGLYTASNSTNPMLTTNIYLMNDIFIHFLHFEMISF